MYEFQRRLIQEAAKYGKLNPKETENLPLSIQEENSTPPADLGKAFRASMMKYYKGFGSKDDVTQRRDANRIVLIGKRIDEWAKDGAKFSTLPEYFTVSGKKFDAPFVNNFVKANFGPFKIEGGKLVKEEAEVEGSTLEEATHANLRDFETRKLARSYHQASVGAASSGNKNHASDWGVGYRLYLEVFIGDHTKNNEKPMPSSLNPSLYKLKDKAKAGWEQARKDLLTKKKLNAEMFEGGGGGNVAIPKTPTSELGRMKGYPNRVEVKGDKVVAVYYNGKKITGHGINTVQDIIRGAVSSLEDKYDTEFLILKESLEEASNKPVEEAYAPDWAYAQRNKNPILGQFKHRNKTFEYRAIVQGTPGSEWALSNGLTHEIFYQPVFGDHRDARYGIVLKTRVRVAEDEDEHGKPVLRMWETTGHQVYPKPN